MDSEFGETVCVGLIIFGAVALIGWPLSYFAAREEWRIETVAHGCAAYTMDPATGATTWDWKDKP